VKPAWRWLSWTLASLVAFIAISALGMTWLVATSSGREVLAGQAEEFTNGRIPGSMKIGKLESVGFAEPVATDIEFFHPNGDRVMYVRRAKAVFDLRQLLGGKVGFAKARADGGEVVIEITEDGRVMIEEAFKPADAETKPMDERSKLELHNMHFEGMTLVLRMSAETRFVLDGVRGFMSVWRRDTPGVRVTLGEVQGTFRKPQVFGNTLVLENMEGEVWAQEDHVVSMKINTKLGNGAIDATLDYYKRPETKARLRLDPETGSGANLVAFGTNVRSWFSDKLEVSTE
jgi:hypothetical protein